MSDSLDSAFSSPDRGGSVESTEPTQRVLPADKDMPRREQSSDNMPGDTPHKRHRENTPPPQEPDRVEISEAARKALEEGGG